MPAQPDGAVNDAPPAFEEVLPNAPLPEPAEAQAERQRLNNLVDDSLALDADGVLERFKVPFADDLGYDPLDAENLEIIQASPYALNDDELAVLEARGFVISARQSEASFIGLYERIYNFDLPVYISADSLLHALHRAYGTLLKSVEVRTLKPAMNRWLSHLHGRLAEGEGADWGPEVIADLDVYFAVARSLLNGRFIPPEAGGDADTVEALIQAAEAAEGIKGITLFGAQRRTDMSQFKPRGHYASIQELEQYFRAMMWLGRIDLRFIELDQSGDWQVHRRAIAAALVIDKLIDASARADWARIEAVLRSFVGPQDFVTVDTLEALRDALPGEAQSLSDAEDADLIETLTTAAFNVQRIRGDFFRGGLGENKRTALPVSFTLFGQRYIVDSEVLSNVVWDSLQAPRMMPDPLDVAFAALGNSQAASLLEDELRAYGDYPGHLAAMRALMDDRPKDAWTEDLYSGWINALRALSPDPEIAADPAGHGRPAVMGTEAFGRRLLNAQLGSWSELRHDNLLYAKPSYTGGEGCDYPDGYVDPVPEFYGVLIQLAEMGLAVSEGPLAALDPEGGAFYRDWWQHMHMVASELKVLAEQQVTGEPFTDAQVMWLEQAVDIRPDDYVGYVTGGWYGKLLLVLDNGDPYTSDLLTVDIHTQPTDEMGALVGKVMHMATGFPRLMVVTVESCTGPRAYAGPVYSTHNFVTENFERLTDGDWAERYYQEGAVELPWLEDLVVR